MENNNSFMSITSLPDEIISLILLYNKPHDIMHFACTCKQFYELIVNNEILWRAKYSELIPNDMVKLVYERGSGNCLNEVINFYKLKQSIYKKLLSMSPEYYWRFYEIRFEETKEFFSMAIGNNFNYYLTIYILQDIIKKGNLIIDSQKCLKPLYTLTVMYYAKLVLRNLIHTYLAMKWIQKSIRKELTPVFITTFFIQWLDVTKMSFHEEVEHKVDLIVKKVEDILKRSGHPRSKQTGETATKKYSELNVLYAITHAVYNYESKPSCSSEKSLNIVEEIDPIDGSVISYGAVYEAVAKRFGLQCDLIAFPNHMFLEWRHSEDLNSPLYTIDLSTGEIRPKRQCPFPHNGKYRYCPNSLLRFIYVTYMKSKPHKKDIKSQNASLLWELFDIGNTSKKSPYAIMYIYLLEKSDSPAMNTTLNLKYMENIQLELLEKMSAVQLAIPSKDVNRGCVIKKRHSGVTYAVGLICYHTLYNYMCVIRDWESNGPNTPCRPDVEYLQFGQDQPFYSVTAMDYSKRFIAQEYLQVVSTPSRLLSLEDQLAKDFTHFDGFSYIPNEEKLVQYPEELAFIAALKARIAGI